ncbi:hypothetical protein Dimus_017774, partial [Dionaea muscipula]
VSFLTQRAKAKYFAQCDKNSSFFYAIEKSHTARRQISHIENHNGDVESMSSGEAESFICYYKTLLGTSAVTSGFDFNMAARAKLLPISSGVNLIRPVDKEIKEARWSIGDNKTPGPDGYTSCFYKHARESIDHSFIKVVKEFFESGRTRNQINHSYLMMIPKKANALKVEEFRPIACCNVLYKVIAKILATRLASCLGDFIDRAQTAFVRGRSMKDNVCLLQELMRKYSRKRGTPRCLLSVDFKKAYDSC